MYQAVFPGPDVFGVSTGLCSAAVFRFSPARSDLSETKADQGDEGHF